MSCFHFPIIILCMELLRVIVLGKFSLGLNCLEGISLGGYFSIEMGPISWDYLKEIKKKFYQLKQN